MFRQRGEVGTAGRLMPVKRIENNGVTLGVGDQGFPGHYLSAEIMWLATNHNNKSIAHVKMRGRNRAWQRSRGSTRGSFMAFAPLGYCWKDDSSANEGD